MDQEYHQMVLEEVHPSGEETWNCPTCGRRFLLQWPPNYKKIVIEPGDEQVAHSGGKGGLSMGSVQRLPADEAKTETSIVIDDPRLAPWTAWLDEVSFEDLWNNET